LDFGEKLEAKHREKNDVSDSMDLTMKMIPVMVRAVDEMRSLGASDDKILRFLYATIDELQGS